MNRLIESNKPWLSLLALAIIIVFLAFLFKPKTIDFSTNADQAIKLMKDTQNQVSLTDLAGKQLIDLRSMDQFAQGHADNAINIPVRKLLDDESLELFDRLLQSGQVAVLYGNDELQAAAPCLLLQQMGYFNLKTLNGVMAETNELKEPALPTTEIMLLDTAAMKAKVATKVLESSMKKPQNVVPVRKAASSGGGC
ncbi:MAG TPA: rhodanese-like domain-containing protein [Prolixibacteraceae bacterium]|jgi:rhodanese-related sulfurtransferase